MEPPSTSVFDAKVTIRCLLYWLPRIKSKLKCHVERDRLFRNTVFGPWLDIPNHENDSHLINYFLQQQVYVETRCDSCTPIPYKIGDKVFHFGRDEFLSVTGFRGGTLSFRENSDSPFCARVFATIDQRKRKKIKPIDLILVFNNPELWNQLSNDDAVRVCLLIVAELVFTGRQSTNYVPNFILSLVENIDEWNAYPWGEYLWSRFYQKTVNVVPLHYNRFYSKKVETCPKKLATYNLEGFVWALKIWILETCPSSNIWWKKDPTKTPSCIAWSKLITFSKLGYDRLFGLGPNTVAVQRPQDLAVDAERPEIVGDEGNSELQGPNPISVQRPQDLGVDAETPEIVGDEGNSELQGQVSKVPAGGFANNVNVDHVSSDSELATLKTILGLLDKDGGKVAVVDLVKNRLAAIEKTPEECVNKDSSIATPTDMDTEDGILNYIEPGAYPSSMSQLTKIDDLTSLDPVVDCFAVANDIDIRLPNLNEPLCETAVNKKHDFDDYVELGNEGTQYSLDTKAEGEEHIVANQTVSSSGFDDDYEDEIVGEAVSESKDRKDDEGENLKETGLSNEEHIVADHIVSSSEIVGEAMSDSQDRKADEGENLKETGLYNEEHTVADHIVSSSDIVGEAMSDSQDRKADEGENLQEVVFGNAENKLADVTMSEGLDRNAAEGEKEVVREVDKVGDAVLENEGNKAAAEEPKQQNTFVIENLQNKTKENIDENKLPKWKNVVKVGERPCAKDIFNTLKRKRNEGNRQKKEQMTDKNVVELKRTKFTGKALQSPYTVQPSTTPTVNRKRFKRTNEKDIMPIAFATDDGEVDIEEWTEDLSRPPNCLLQKVTIPSYMKMFLNKNKKSFHRFPWGKYDVVANRKFWCALLGYGRDCRKGWLMDEHLDLWVDLMWAFRPSNADWAMAGPFLYPSLKTNDPNPCHGNGVWYPVPWADVEKVYFPLNVPEDHFLLAELIIRTGVVTFYDSLGTPTPKTRDKFLEMRDKLQKQLPAYLCKVGAFKAKGIKLPDYNISFQVGVDVPVQADPYGDCGVWVCINLYRLSHNLRLEVDDPLQVALAYREHMVEYFWKYKIPLKNGM